MMIAFSTFTAVTDRHPVQHRLPWHKLARLLVTHTERDTKGGPLWSPATYPPGATRARVNVAEVSCLVADIDHKADADTFGVVSDALENLRHLIHTSHSHNPDNVAFRVVVPLDKPIQACAYDDIFRRWELFLRHCRIKLDSACSDPCRMFYLPTCKPGAERVAYSRDGDLMRPDHVLPALPPPKPRPTTPQPTVDTRPETRIILERALNRCYGEGQRELNAFWLATQLRDNGYSQAEADPVLRDYHAQVEAFGAHPFALKEAMQALNSAFKHAPREPWTRRSTGYAAHR